MTKQQVANLRRPSMPKSLTVRHDETKPSWHGNSRNGNSSFDHSEHVPLPIGGSSKDWRIMACYPRV